MTIRTALFLALASLAVAGCGGAQAHDDHAHAPGDHAHAHPQGGAAKAGLKVNGEAAVGDRTTCMVSGEEFTVTADSPKVEQGGKTYYLCCGGCAKKFQADPQKYIQKQRAQN